MILPLYLPACRKMASPWLKSPKKLWESRVLFNKESACRTFVETLLHYRDQGDYKVHAFVFMPDHFHALLTPGMATSLERAVQCIKGGSAHRLGEALQTRFPVWQRGFSDHRIRDAEDYRIHVGYIEQNPVKQRLALNPGEYLWSSASGRFRLDGAPQGLKPSRVTQVGGTAKAVP